MKQENQFKGKKILVTGGVGSIGSAIVEELLKFEPHVVRVLDLSELKESEMQEQFSEYSNVRFLLGDVRDKDRLYRAMEEIDIVFHTASYKHVLSCEYNPFEAVKTNVMGTQNLIDVAISQEIEKFIFTSSDKAVNPSNVMGATKLLAEKLVTSANYHKGHRRTIFSSVRFGNVLASSGSVINLFMKQIRERKTLTITSPTMTRFIMSLHQAVNLLLTTEEMAQGGEIFIFKMPSIRISDLAQAMIDELAPTYGWKNREYPTRTIGKKPGEKPYEELLTENESDHSLETNEMFIVLPEIEPSVNVDLYKNARPAAHMGYTSNDSKLLTLREIKQILLECGVLDRTVRRIE
ncbi:MAG: SDR family NAD(P)-dependent oxidoreductase [Candidatus Bathyarchaeia archaeon]